MEDQANTLVPLPDYFRQQGCLANPQARAAIVDEIATGKLAAYMKAESAPTPASKSFATMVREALAETQKPTHVLARRIPKVMCELEKAAMAVDADWALLNRLVVEVAAPVAAANDTPEPISDEAMDRLKKSVQWARAEIILSKIADLGLVALDLEPPEKNGGGGDRAKVRAAISEKEIRKTDFKNAWDFMLRNHLAHYRSD